MNHYSIFEKSLWRKNNEYAGKNHRRFTAIDSSSFVSVLRFEA